MSDNDLVMHYKKSGDKEVLGEFFKRYMHLVFAVCMRYLKNEEHAKDAVMEIFESLDTKLIQFEVRNFQGWLHTISRNYCLMALRKNKKEVEIDNMKIIQYPDVENSVILHLDNEEDDNTFDLKGFLEQLKESQRKCLEMMYFQDMSYKAIALETGYTLKQVKSYIQNGKRKLKILLEQEK